MATNKRVHMVAEKIRNVVAMEMRRLSDPRLALVTITAAIVSPDLRNAKVYWVSSNGKDKVHEIEEGLRSASGILRRGVGEALGLRCVPQLRFYYDETLDTVDEVERLLKKAREKDGRTDEPSGQSAAIDAESEEDGVEDVPEDGTAEEEDSK